MLCLSWGCVKPAIDVRPTDRLVAPGFDEPLPKASRAEWDAPAQRLVDDLPRAVRRHYWGIERFDKPAKNAPDQTYRLRALLADGRTAHITAWAVHEQRVAVVVRVGPFGDPALERGFIDELAATFRDKPMPKRNWKYELPETLP